MIDRASTSKVMNSEPFTRHQPHSKDWLLAKLRPWHKKGGLFAAVFLLVASASGILLNYKQPVFKTLGLEQKEPDRNGKSGEKAKPGQLGITTGRGLATVPVSLERVLELARDKWGDVPLERIELKEEHGELTYKIKQKAGGELWVNAINGDHLAKGKYERISKSAASGAAARQTDWGKILLDLHTGKIGGEVGKAVLSISALMLLFLTVSGVYLWLKPVITRRNSKSR